ncbi:MAG: catalase [Sphingomonadales bacterium]
MSKASKSEGHGGERHQTVETGGARSSPAQGAPAPDNHNSPKIGKTGPTLMEDFVFRRKLFHFNHGRIC